MPPAQPEREPVQEDGLDRTPQTAADEDRDRRLITDLQRNSSRKDHLRHRHEISATLDDDDGDDEDAAANASGNSTDPELPVEEPGKA